MMFPAFRTGLSGASILPRELFIGATPFMKMLRPCRFLWGGYKPNTRTITITRTIFRRDKAEPDGGRSQVSEDFGVAPSILRSSGELQQYEHSHLASHSQWLPVVVQPR